MNPFNIQIDELDGLEPVVKGSTFSLLQQAKTLVERARAQALELLHQANLEALEIQEKAFQLGEFQQSQLARKIRDKTHDETVAQTLKWLIDEQAIEAAVVESLESRVREIMASVLKEWFAEQDPLQQVAHRLAAIVREKVQQQPCKLRLHPEDCEALATQLKQLVDTNQIECVADESLNHGQAVIDTEFLSIEYDLARHQTDVLTALRQMYVEETTEHVEYPTH